MGAVLVLTPLIISSWPAIATAVVGAAAAMGYSVAGGAQTEQAPRKTKKRTVEAEIENSEVVAEAMGPGQTIVIQKGDVTIKFGQDERGACSVCVTGERQSERELKQIGQDVAGRVVQQIAYH